MSSQNQWGLSPIFNQKFTSIVKALNQNSSVDTSIKTSFKAIRDVLEMQASNIEQLFKIVGKSATKSQLHMLLSHKVSVVDMSVSIGQLTDIVNRKVNSTDIEQLVSHEVTKFKKQFDQALKEVTSEQTVSSCILKQLADNQDNARNRLDHMHQKIQGISKLTANHIQILKSDIEKVKNELVLKQSEYVDREMVEKMEKQFKSEMEEINRIIDKQLKKATKSTKKSFDSMQQLIKSSIDKLKQQLESQLTTKIDTITKETVRTHENQAQPHQNADISQITQHIKQLKTELDSKTSLSEVKMAFKAFQQDTLYNLQTLRETINKRIDNNHNSFTKYQKDQNIIYETLCAVNIIGRWSCKYQQQYACWDTQLANTLKQNWHRHQDILTVRMSGMYHVVVGCFMDTEITVLANRKVISKRIVKNQSQDISRTMEFYVFLYENTELRVSFGPFVQIQGFISLQRM